MKIFVALFVATLAVAVQGSSYVEPAWSVGLNGWNNYGLTSSYPYGVNLCSPVTYGGRKTSVEPNAAKTNPWGLPAAVYDYGFNHLGVIPVAGKYAAPIAGLVHETPLVGYGVNQKLIVAGHSF